MKHKLEEIEILLCRCQSDEHQILVHYNEDDKIIRCRRKLF
jgi:hypothetical protein